MALAARKLRKIAPTNFGFQAKGVRCRITANRPIRATATHPFRTATDLLRLRGTSIRSLTSKPHRKGRQKDGSPEADALFYWLQVPAEIKVNQAKSRRKTGLDSGQIKPKTQTLPQANQAKSR
jgi:hypothetical protein